MSSSKIIGATRRSMAMGPCVRNLISLYQLDPTKINSTGPNQIILKSDVLAYISQHRLQPNPTGTSRLSSEKPKTFTPNLDLTGHQPKPGPEGFSRIAKELLGM